MERSTKPQNLFSVLYSCIPFLLFVLNCKLSSKPFKNFSFVNGGNLERTINGHPLFFKKGDSVFGRELFLLRVLHGRLPKKNQSLKGNRFLVSVSVLGSAGPIRFVVNEDELVAAVINTALKSYAREDRLPFLGSDLNNFILYCPIAGSEALSPWATIGSVGLRNFMLCKKPQTENNSMSSGAAGGTMSRKGLEGLVP